MARPNNVNKVIVNSEEIVNITSETYSESKPNLGGNTAIPETVLEGTYFYGSDGAHSQGKFKLGEKSITANGTYRAAADGLGGYEKVDINVPIPKGYVKPEGTFAIGENGVYKVAEYENVQVSVQEESGGFDTGDATATPDDIRRGKTAYLADGIASGTIADYLGEKEDVEGGEKFDGFFKIVEKVDQVSTNTVYLCQDKLSFVDVANPATGVLFPWLMSSKIGPGISIQSFYLDSLPNHPAPMNQCSWFLYLYTEGKEVTRIPAFHPIQAEVYATFSTEEDGSFSEALFENYKAGGYLLAQLAQGGPLYRVYPTILVDGIKMAYAELDEKAEDEEGEFCREKYFYVYSYDKCKNYSGYFKTATATAPTYLPDIYFETSSSGLYWQPLCVALNTSDFIPTDDDAQRSFVGVISIDESTEMEEGRYGAYVSADPYMIYDSNEDSSLSDEAPYFTNFVIGSLISGGEVESYPIYSYYKDAQTSFCHRSVEMVDTLPKYSNSNQIYWKKEKPNSLFRTSLVGFSGKEYVRSPFLGGDQKANFSFSLENSPIEGPVLTEDGTVLTGKLTYLSYINNAYSPGLVVLVSYETEGYKTTWQQNTYTSGYGSFNKKNTETGEWESFDIDGRTPEVNAVPFTVTGDIPENMREYFAEYFEPQSYDEYVLSTATALPTEISTAAEMNSKLQSSKIGSVFKYTGETTSEFENGELYVVEEDK